MDVAEAECRAKRLAATVAWVRRRDTELGRGPVGSETEEVDGEAEGLEMVAAALPPLAVGVGEPGDETDEE